MVALSDGDERAGVVGALIKRRDRLIGALLIGNNLVNILASSLTTSLFLAVFGDSGVAFATLLMTALLVIFSEVLPKSWAISAPDRFAMFVAPFVRLFVAVVGPLSSGVNAIVRGILAIFGVNLSREASMLSAHEELRSALDHLHREGGFKKADRDRMGGLSGATHFLTLKLLGYFVVGFTLSASGLYLFSEALADSSFSSGLVASLFLCYGILTLKSVFVKK